MTNALTYGPLGCVHWGFFAVTFRSNAPRKPSLRTSSGVRARSALCREQRRNSCGLFFKSTPPGDLPLSRCFRIHGSLQIPKCPGWELRLSRQESMTVCNAHWTRTLQCSMSGQVRYPGSHPPSQMQPLHCQPLRQQQCRNRTPAQ